MSIKISIDHIDNELIKGWAFDNEKADNKVVIEVFIGDQLNCIITANQFREDLNQKGMADGYCAFSHLFSSPINDEDLKSIKIRTEEQEVNVQPLIEKILRKKNQIKKQKDDLTVFVHIPKTGGSTIRSILAQNYQGSVYEFFGDIETYKRFKERQSLHSNKYDLIHGHVSYGIHEGISKDAKYFTFLRDPIKRLFSEYFFGFYPEGGLYQKITKQGMTLSDYIEHQPSYLKNLYLKYVAGYHPADSCELNEKELLNQAKEKLESNFILCGITEYFDESILMLAKQLKWFPPIYIKKNVSQINPISYIPKSQLAKLREQLYLEYDLYEFATELLKNKIIQQPPSFWRALQEMEELIQKLNVDYDNDKNRIYTLKHGPDKKVIEMQSFCKSMNIYLES